MSGFFSDSHQPKKSTKSRSVPFDTTDLLQELGKMREELKHRADFPQKSSVLFEKTSETSSKQTSSDKPKPTPTGHPAEGYTPLHQFRVDPPHPEIGATATSASSTDYPSLDEFIPRKKEEENGFWKDPSHKTTPSCHATPPVRSPRKESTGKQKSTPPFLANDYSESFSRHDNSHLTPSEMEDVLGPPEVIPLPRRRSATTVPMSQNHTFRVDQKHGGAKGTPAALPKIVVARPLDSKRKKNSNKSGISEILEFSFLAFGMGAIVCGILLYSRVWFFKMEALPVYGPHVLIAGALLLLVGVMIRFITAYKKRKIVSQRRFSRFQEASPQYSRSENESLSETYQRLLTLRTQVNEMIDHVEEQVLEPQE